MPIYLCFGKQEAVKSSLLSFFSWSLDIYWSLKRKIARFNYIKCKSSVHNRNKIIISKIDYYITDTDLSYSDTLFNSLQQFCETDTIMISISQKRKVGRGRITEFAQRQNEIVELGFIFGWQIRPLIWYSQTYTSS